MIEVQNITKVYGKKQTEFTALRDVSFDIPDNSIVSIIGKSGSGKSTLMHIMSGLDHADSGKVLIRGKDILKLKSKAMEHFRATEMGFIFQSFFIEPNQSVFQNVMLPLEIAGVRPELRTKLVMEALEKVELTDKAKNRARDLSGGQKQRLAIARAIVHKPRLIFADEPTGNLDSATGDKVVQLLFDLNKKMGSTLIIVTHDEDLARKAQIKIELKDGVVVSVTSPKVKAVAPVIQVKKKARLI
jgi:putative ABC transport system ATP-binding protein